MKQRSLLVTALLVAVLAGSLPLAAHQSMTLKKNLHVAAGETQENVMTFGGHIVVEGTVKESVVAFGGTIEISGEVGEAVIGIGSAITIRPTAVIRGDLVSIGGKLVKEAGCSVQGDTVDFDFGEIGARLFKGNVAKGIFSFSLIPLLLILKLIGLFVWFLLAFFVAALFPRQIAYASHQIRAHFWPIFWTGLLGIVIFTALFLLAALLCLILVGIPILFSLFLAGIIIKIFGRVVLLFLIGESLLRSLGSRKPSTLGAVTIGLLAVGLAGFIPVLGFLFSFVLNILGWGVVLRTKFGTKENWFHHKNHDKK
ncbi:MAG: hypothetical protein MUQ00_07235 [Candidatus Aminicenantes bacterium]|nr:hypothetical protein [Candidatus Aminicenantes bacterium]